MAERWRTIDVQTTTGPRPGGGFQTIKLVIYETIWGDRGEVEVPADRFTAELAASLIEAEVEEISKLREA